jgi:hypothetical protein
MIAFVVSQYDYEDIALFQSTHSTDYTSADEYVKYTPSFFHAQEYHVYIYLCIYILGQLRFYKIYCSIFFLRRLLSQ